MKRIMVTKIAENGKSWCECCGGYKHIHRHLRIGDKGFALCDYCYGRLKCEVEK